MDINLLLLLLLLLLLFDSHILASITLLMISEITW